MLPLLLWGAVWGQKAKTNVILIGVHHFNNPGFDQAKMPERNILEAKDQEALDRICNKVIAQYKPEKVFVEYPMESKEKLNGFYQKFLQGKPFFKADTLKKESEKRFYSENEVFQFGFRMAKMAGNDAIYPMDYDEVPLRFDLLQQHLDQHGAIDETVYQKKLADLTLYMNDCLQQSTLEEVLNCINSQKQYKLNKGLYVSLLNRLNKGEDFFGSDLVSAWYKRNLIMFSNIQNQVSGDEKNIVIILGAGHAAMFDDLIPFDERFNLIRINRVLH